MPLDNFKTVISLAREHNLAVHMDGARVFNAALALGVPASELASHVDSVMFCLSKGLAAPVGSMLVGSADFIKLARRNRKAVGGGMRQVGVIAAGGLYALNHMIDHLADDRANAKRLAAGLRKIGWSVAAREEIQTNIFFVDAPVGLEGREVAHRAEGARRPRLSRLRSPDAPRDALRHQAREASTAPSKPSPP